MPDVQQMSTMLLYGLGVLVGGSRISCVAVGNGVFVGKAVAVGNGVFVKNGVLVKKGVEVKNGCGVGIIGSKPDVAVAKDRVVGVGAKGSIGVRDGVTKGSIGVFVTSSNGSIGVRVGCEVGALRSDGIASSTTPQI